MMPAAEHSYIEQPKLILHFDVNKTLINKDTATGKSGEEILINQLAEDTVFQWDKSLPKMSFETYVRRVLVPGEGSDPFIKEKRRKIISGFLEIVKEYPEVSEEVAMQYQKLKAKATDSVFPSFVKLITKMKEQHISFIIVLRTFGKDLQEVQEEIQKRTGIEFTRHGFFEKGVLRLRGDENETLSKTNEIFHLFASSKEHIAIQDNFDDWNGSGEKAKWGKKFVFENSGGRKATHLSFFFDDNLRGHPEEDIVAPYTREGAFVSTDRLVGKILFPVHTGQAILNENYYIELVNKGLKENGCNHLLME